MIIQEEKVEIVDIDNKKEKEKDEEQKVEKFEKVSSEPKNSKHIIIYISVFFGILLLILFLIFAGFSIYNLNNSNKIAQGIYIYGINVSDLTKEEAISKVNAGFEPVKNTEIKLISSNYQNTIIPSEINLDFNITSAVNYAFSIGKSGNIFTDDYDIFSTMINGLEITPTFSLDEKSLQSALNEMSKSLPNAIVNGSYYIEDSTLIITKGTKGYVVDAEKTTKNIKNKLTDFSYLTSPVELSLVEKDPEPIDLDKIYQEVHKDATDAYYTKNPYTIHPSTNGVDFKISLEEAKKKLASSEKECKIALKTLYPKITTNMIGIEAFPDLLGDFSTKYAASNTNRTTNLKLAAKKINGTVLLPGETFSYNKVVGARTIAAGYKEAAIYQNGEVVDGLGGGICQISTTLFNAALFANLDIVELHNHQFVPSYVGAGRDATVVYGSKDFKFKNNRNYAIKIQCSVSGGVASFKIFGIKESTEYDVKVKATITSNTSSSIKSVTYRTLSLNGKQVSKEKIYTCTYKKH